MKAKILWIVTCLLVTACVQVTTNPTEVAPTVEPSMPNPASAYCEQQGYHVEIRTAPDGSQSGACIFPDGSECDEWAYFRGECAPTASGGSLPNPASAYCEQQGYQVEIRTAPDGSQSGVCIFPDGSECDEWAYFRGECAPASSGEPGWQVYTHDTLGYSFSYPAGAELTISDEPKKSLMLSGGGMGSETWGVSHPPDMDEYRPPDGVDLYQWLADHHLLGEVRLPDRQIAGTTAIHFRHERSPQSPADDRYYFAHDGQLYMILIGHSGEVEDWELNNRFLDSFRFNPPASGAIPTAIPTPLPVDPAAHADWGTYTHPVYGFSFRIPEDWVVEEVSSDDPLLGGHALILRTIYDAQKQTIRLTFRQAGEEVLLWPTGVGQGEFISIGSLDIGGEPAVRKLLVCPTSEVTSVWYNQAEDQPNLVRGGMEFGILFSASTHCEPGYSLSGETLQIGETIIASLQVP